MEINNYCAIRSSFEWCNNTQFCVVACNSAYKYLCSIIKHNTLPKLIITPSHINGYPLNFNQFFINDYLPACLNSFKELLQHHKLQIHTFNNILTFSKSLQISQQNSQNCQQAQNIEQMLKNGQLDSNFFTTLNQIIIPMIQLNQNKSLRRIKRKNHILSTNRNQPSSQKIQMKVLQVTCRKKIWQIIKESKLPLNLNHNILQNHQNSEQKKMDNEQFQNDDNKLKQLIRGNLFQISQVEEQKLPEQEQLISGVSIVQKIKIKKLSYFNKSQQVQSIQPNTQLIKKSMRAINNFNKNSNIFYRFNQELKIIQYLSGKGTFEFLCDYYVTPPPAFDGSYYLSKIDISLHDFLINHHSRLGLSDFFNLSISIVRNIKDLHDNGIVHRDLKPQNIMIYNQEKKWRTKIIDFSDAFIIAQSFSKEKGFQQLFGTIPYSPIQTQVTYKNYRTQGLNCKQIDYWSVGILLSLLFYGKHEISFSRIFWKQIKSLWPEDFLHHNREQTRKNINLIDQVMQIILHNLLQVHQNRRLNLTSILEILETLYKFYQRAIKFQTNFDSLQCVFKINI